MFDYLKGAITSISPSAVVIEVGGLGIRVTTAPTDSAQWHTGQHVQLPVSVVIREDNWTVYGFAEAADRDVFESVQSVSGVGPRTAMAMVSSLGADGVSAAVSAEDVKTLTTVPGIGQKGAQRLILELAGKLRLGTVDISDAVVGESEVVWQDHVHEGLVSLGWSSKEVLAAVKAVAARAEGDIDVADAMRDALQLLARK